ncbi:hypothetical protein [Pseudoalteromonas sp. NBT06-2]|nr:hypothetical protein [Pseudoalteromonas sp. NBT06-2]
MYFALLVDSSIEGRITEQSQSVYFDGAQVKLSPVESEAYLITPSKG